MSEKIKIIWDFRGSVAEQTAKHHQIHLDDYVKETKLENFGTGHEVVNEFHSIAYIIVEKVNMILVRDALKPHRAELIDN